ncbi:hypothetical protein P43SY_010293 [Pythium insidiosum]|uniref:Uncharacterized protein n=1 Tax=Pythium insidiosum TaxID=114742 RepID=A0AAD5Q355_PYTIN|nr:hypothetical protein P43SY_010293 [Pythium insidiosum]
MGPEADAWASPAPDVATLLLGDDGASLLRADAPLDPEVALPAAASLAQIADAMREMAALRSRFGSERLFERVSLTASACSWLTHVVQALLELIRLQEAEQLVERAPLALLETYGRAQIAGSAQHRARRDALLREAIEQRRELECQATAARAGEVEATRQHDVMADLYDRRGAALESVQQQLAAVEGQRDRLEARVLELEDQLQEARRSACSAPAGLTREQARLVYSFLWQHGYGQGNASLWGELVRACAHADPTLAPVDISLIVLPAGRSVRAPHPAPDASALDDSGLADAPLAAPRLSPASAGRSSQAAGARPSPPTSSDRPLVSTSVSARRCVDFYSDAPDDDPVGGYDIDDTADVSDEVSGVGDQERVHPARALSSPASSVPPAPACRSLAAPPVISIDSDDDGSPSLHSARGVKRRAASLVAEDAMSARRLARQFGTEGLGTPVTSKRGRSSPVSQVGTSASSRSTSSASSELTSPFIIPSTSSTAQVTAVQSAPSAAQSAVRQAAPAAAATTTGAGAAGSASAVRVVQRALVASAALARSAGGANGADSGGGSGSTTGAASRVVSAADASSGATGALTGGGSHGAASAGATPLTFTGPRAQSLIAAYTSAPVAESGDSLTLPVFSRVPLPFVLGSVRGRSSVLSFSSLDDIHARVRFGVSVQRVRGGQTPFFPNYAPVKNANDAQLACYGPEGFLSMVRLLDQRPWDAMWRGRVRHLFLFDPNQLSAAQVNWIHAVLRFMYGYRRQYWMRQHWFPLSRQENAPRLIVSAYKTREAADRELTTAFATLIESAPAGVTSPP